MPKADLSVIGIKRGPEVFEYAWRDVVLYALGVGARASDLPYVYERAPGGLKVLPSFAVKAASQVFPNVGQVEWSLFLHGEQRLVLHQPFPPQGRLVQEGMVTDIWDKGKAAVYQISINGALEDGSPVYEGQWSIFYVGAGGFGGHPGPRAEPRHTPRDRVPEVRASQVVAENQAALYRLSSDLNPLHIDPTAAAVGGFDRPIVHGLCTYGFAARMFVDSALGGDVARLKEFAARFAKPVYPGDELTLQAWRQDGHYVLEASTPGGVVLANGLAVAADQASS